MGQRVVSHLHVCGQANKVNNGYVCFLKQAAEQDYEKEKLNERIAKLSGGVAVIQVSSEGLT